MGHYFAFKCNHYWVWASGHTCLKTQEPVVEVIPTNDHFRESSASPILEEDSQAEELVMEAQGMYNQFIQQLCITLFQTLSHS